MNRRGIGGWALTLLFSSIIMLIFIGGFFYAYTTFSGKATASRTIGANLDGLSTSGEAIMLLRLQVGDASVAELLANGQTATAVQALRSAIKEAFGDAACRASVDNAAIDVGCPELTFADATASVKVPAYDKSVHTITLEVGR